MAQLRKILLVDDDDDLREALSEQLVMTEDFDVFEADSGATAMQKTKEGLYDLIILDVGLPDTDGRELCRLMRKQGVKAPVLMLTGHDSDADTILGLDAGANDYVTKPFVAKELMARIRTQLRRSAQPEEGGEDLTCGPIELHPDTAEVMRNGEPVPVSRIEFFVLAELIGAKGRVLSRDHLLRKVWGYGNAGDGRVVDNLIYRLRNKIEDDPANPELLLTVRGFGYRMKA